MLDLLRALSTVQCGSLRVGDRDASLDPNQLPPLNSLYSLNLDRMSNNFSVSKFSDFVCSLSTKFPNLQQLRLHVHVDDNVDWPDCLHRLSTAEPVAVTRLELQIFRDVFVSLQPVLVHLFRVHRIASHVKVVVNVTDDSDPVNLITTYLSAYQLFPHARGKFTIELSGWRQFHLPVFSRVFGEFYDCSEYEMDTVTDASSIRHVLGAVVVDAIQQTNAHIRSLKCYQTYHRQFDPIACIEIDILLNDKEFCVHLFA